MSSRAVDLNLFPDPVYPEDASDGTGSLGSLSAKSRAPGPDDQIGFSDLIRVGPDSCSPEGGPDSSLHPVSV